MKKHCHEGFGRLFLIAAFMLLLSACGTTHRYAMSQDGAPNYAIDVDGTPDATPKDEPYSKHGNPRKYTVLGRTYYVRKSALGYDETGIASWYGMKFHAYRTSSGELYDVSKMTAANKELPIPCYAKVTNLKNGKQVIVKVNDRGPFHQNRIIDLSYVAARKLGIWPQGTGLVRVETIDPRTWNASPTAVKTVPVKGTPRIYMQIGAFRIRSNAEGLVSRIKLITPDPLSIKTFTLNGAPIYKVWIGPLASVDKSDTLFAALEREHLGNPMTVIQ